MTLVLEKLWNRFFPEINNESGLNVIILNNLLFWKENDNWMLRCLSQLACILFIEAGQLLSNILVCCVEGSVDFLEEQKKRDKHEELLISNGRFNQFISSENNSREHEFESVGAIILPSSTEHLTAFPHKSCGDAPLNNLIKWLQFREKQLFSVQNL